MLSKLFNSGFIGVYNVYQIALIIRLMRAMFILNLIDGINRTGLKYHEKITYFLRQSEYHRI